MKKLAYVGLGLAFAIGSQASADLRSKLAAPLSITIGIGTMENSDLSLDSRTMSSMSVEALPSYQIKNWLLGIHFDYRTQGQISSLSEAGDTNLKGSGYLVGLGARYEIDERLFVQGAIDFLGEYDFSKNSQADEDDKAVSPFGLRVKSGYAFLESLPNLSFDLDLQYINFRKFRAEGTEVSATTNQLMASVGITYRFGPSPSLPLSPAAPPPLEPNDTQQPTSEDGEKSE